MIIFRSTSGLDGGAKGRLVAEEGLVHGAVSAREYREQQRRQRALTFLSMGLMIVQPALRAVEGAWCKLNQPCLRQIY